MSFDLGRRRTERKPMTLPTALLLGACTLLPAAAEAQQRVCTPSPRNKIVGGSPARIGDWPGMAVLRQQAANGTSFYFCGGTVIADRWVLTAGHCLHNFMTRLSAKIPDNEGGQPEGRLEVVIGAEDVKAVRPDQVYPVDRAIMHERYRAAVDKVLRSPNVQQRDKMLEALAGFTGEDVALLRLARPWTGAVASLSLGPATDPAERSTDQVRVAGFGVTGGQGLTRYRHGESRSTILSGSDRLLETAIGMVPHPRCRQLHGPAAVIGAGQLCAGLDEGGRDSCSGDSGGPLTITGEDGCPRQIGIVSWGPVCAQKNAYGVYTRISHYADWIQSHTGPLRQLAISEAPPPAKPATGLPAALQGEAERHLDTLLGPARGRVTIGVSGGNRVRLGASVVFEAMSTLAGRLVILDINASREVTLIYPNQYVAQGDLGRIYAGARVTVPGQDYPGFTSFRAVEPVGKGKLIALVVPEEFEIERNAAPRPDLAGGIRPRTDPQAYLMRVIRQIETALMAGGPAGVPTALRRWGYQTVEYEIVR